MGTQPEGLKINHIEAGLFSPKNCFGPEYGDDDRD